MSQDAHETESEKRIQNALNKPYRVELDTCRLIMIIDPKPYQSTHFFLYTIENSPMDFSRQNQTSTNTSKFEFQ